MELKISKYEEKQFADNPNRIMRFEEKHSTWYAFARNKEEIFQAAIYCVLNRLDYYPNYRHNRTRTKPPFTEEQVAALPTSLQGTARAQIREWAIQSKYETQNNIIYDLLQIVKDGGVDTGLAAFRIIQQRQGAEYENWDFEYITDTKND